MAPPRLFDRVALARNRARIAAAPEDFLLARAAADAADRLGAVMRTFTRVVEIGSLSPLIRAAVARPGMTYHRLGPAVARPDIVADEAALPLREGSIDLAISLLALQFVDDLPGTLVQICRALAPDGLFLGAMVGGASLSELRVALTEAEIELEGGAAPHVAPLVDVRDLGALLQRAGFALPVTDSDTLKVRYADMFALMRDLRAMGAANVLAERRRVPARRATFLKAAEFYRERFSDPDGRVRATFEIVWASGWRPAESQPRPLRPGSASVRLADALGVEEVSTGEKAGGG